MAVSPRAKALAADVMLVVREAVGDAVEGGGKDVEALVPMVEGIAEQHLQAEHTELFDEVTRTLWPQAAPGLATAETDDDQA